MGVANNQSSFFSPRQPFSFSLPFYSHISNDLTRSFEMNPPSNLILETSINCSQKLNPFVNKGYLSLYQPNFTFILCNKMLAISTSPQSCFFLPLAPNRRLFPSLDRVHGSTRRIFGSTFEHEIGFGDLSGFQLISLSSSNLFQKALGLGERHRYRGGTSDARFGSTCRKRSLC